MSHEGGAEMYTIRDVLTLQSENLRADHIAVVDGVRRLTYGELQACARRFGTLLTEAGVRRGDRVAIFLPRSVDAVTALFGTWFAGGVAVVINEHLRAQQVNHVLAHSGAGCVVTDSRQLRSLSHPLRGSVTLVNVDQVELPHAPHAPEPVIGADLALLIYTSGSTGLPKGVMVSHDNLLAGARIVSDYLRLTERDVILSLMPFSFDYGLNQLLTAVWVGGTLVVQRSLFPPDICAALEREEVTGVAAVPTLWLQLTGRQSPFLHRALPRLRYLTNTGGRLPERTVRSIRAAHPHVQVYLMYGLTEAFRSTYLPPDQVDLRPSSIGKAIPNVEICVINEEGRPCAPGEVGELVHRGATVTLGYWRDPDATARVFRPHPLEPFRNGSRELVVYSGDLVKMDGDGYLYYVGRRDQLIKSRGFRVSPEEIERCIGSSGLVTNVVAFAEPRDEGDSEIVIAVLPNSPDAFREEALREFCNVEMPEYMQPQVIWQMDQFPLTTSGKPDRGRIQEMYRARHERPIQVAGTARTA